MSDKEEKYRRMAIRLDTGSRNIQNKESDSVLHPEYLVAHACFSCRKSFKKTQGNNHICPECGGSLFWMGRAFRTPKQTDEEQWKKIQLLYAYGFRFHKYRGDYEPLPDKLRDVEEFVKQNQEHELRIRTEKPELFL